MTDAMFRLDLPSAQPLVPSVAEATRLLAALEPLVTSAEPAVVFTSLVRQCVPLICDSATAVIMDAAGGAYRVTWPRPDSETGITGTDAASLKDAGRTPFVLSDANGVGVQLTDDAVLIPITPPVLDGEPEYCGTLELRFSDSRPTAMHALLGQLVLERAIALVHAERLAQQVVADRARAEHLSVALGTNREIGVAMGIVMAEHKLTVEQSFDLLRRVSQHSHRKLREIALEVTETGTIELPAGVSV
jgi:hypothetical protein